MLFLRIYADPNAPARDMRITAFPCVIGRAPESGVAIPNSTVSIGHAVIERLDDGTLQIRDTGSANGLTCEGRRTPCIRLKSEGVFFVGDVRIEAWQENSAEPTRRLERADTVAAFVATLDQRRLLVLGGAALFTVGVLDAWLNSDSSDLVESIFGSVAAAAIATALAAFSFASLSRARNHGWNYLRLLSLLAPCAAIYLAASAALPSLRFNYDGAGFVRPIEAAFGFVNTVACFAMIAVAMFPSARLRTAKRWVLGIALVLLAGDLGGQSTRLGDISRFNAGISYPLREFTPESHPFSALGTSVNEAIRRVEVARAEAKRKIEKAEKKAEKKTAPRQVNDASQSRALGLRSGP